jgi:hypothetical protein
MSNCTDIQLLPKVLKLGDLYAGISCPERQSSLTNCPLGSYCPTPDTIQPCPAGNFCPHKSDQPWITCSRCEEGSLEIKRDAFGYVLFTIVTVLIVVTSFVLKQREYQSNIFAQQLELLARQADSLNIAKRRKVRHEQMERLKPKLDILARRLEQLERATTRNSSNGNMAVVEGGSTYSHMTTMTATSPPLNSLENTTQSTTISTTTTTSTKSPSVAFDAKKLYDALDKDGDGKLSFQELNSILDLNEHELHNFVQRMKELTRSGGTDDENDKINLDDKVSRPVFVKYFFHVLDETTQLCVSTKDAAALWDQIEAENGHKGYVDEAMMYNSSISTFLSDRQIYVLVKVCCNYICILQERMSAFALILFGMAAAKVVAMRAFLFANMLFLTELWILFHHRNYVRYTRNPSGRVVLDCLNNHPCPWTKTLLHKNGAP